MCGIVGYTGPRSASPILIEGLRKLEYRGYDSAGIAVVHDGKLKVERAEGKLSALEERLGDALPEGNVGIGHTRWATHGRPTDENAHPHVDCSGRIAVIHNGIIENYLGLRQRLVERGHKLTSQTDTELIAHLIEEHDEGDLVQAVIGAVRELQGAYALVVVHVDSSRLVAVRTVSPLVVGLGEGENFLASDVPAILSHTRKVHFLEDGQMAVVDRDRVDVMDLEGSPIEWSPTTVAWNPVMAEKGGYDHFMLKEIHEQPQVIQQTMTGRLFDAEGVVDPGLRLNLRGYRRACIVACGTAYYAGCVGRQMLENLAGVPAEVDLASEFRYRAPIIEPNTLAIAVSQSGETIDTLEAMREAKRRGAAALGVINVQGSTIAREADDCLYIHAGPEIGVASTKAYTAMLTAFALLSLSWARVRDQLDEESVRRWISELRALPAKVQQVLDRAPEIRAVGKAFQRYSNFLYLGRGINFPTAMEGALKLKEISYIHAEAYATGEMKHGPIALIDRNMPVLVVATDSDTYDKMVSNVEEVRAREGIVIALANDEDTRIGEIAEHVIRVPRTHELISPIVNVIALQLLAYDIARRLGLDVDQPRNLAKSVTVE